MNYTNFYISYFLLDIFIMCKLKPWILFTISYPIFQKKCFSTFENLDCRYATRVGRFESEISG
jgi:hypothetical protein